MKFSGRLSAFLLGCLASPALADTWASFQNGGKVSFADTAAHPRTTWNIKCGIAWEIPLAGYGQSSPVIDDQLIYVTSTSGKMKENLHIQGFDRGTGKLLWKYNAHNSNPEEDSGYISRAAPSPVCDANGVIAFFEGGNVIALNKQGKVRWQRDLVADLGPIKTRHGLGSSLEQNDRYVFVWVERQENPYVLALAKNTGQTVWKTEGLGSTSWSSPRLVPVEDFHHLVISGVGKLVGVDPESGKHLWTFEAISGNSTPTPVPLGGGRFLIGATMAGSETGGGKTTKSNGLVKIDKTGRNGQFQASYVWKAGRATSSFGSPLAYDGHAYFVNQSGVVYCLDLKTGQEQYAKRTDSSIWATPIGIGKRVFLFGKNGTTTVIESGREFKTIAVNSLWKNEPPPVSPLGERQMSFGGPVLYAVAVADAELIMRRGDRMYKVSP